MKRLRDVMTLTGRNLVHIRRDPLQLSDVTVQPILFSLLFVYVFGSAIPIHDGSYKDFAIPGLMLLNLTTSSMGTAVGLVSDITTGAIDRFRTLPMWRSAILFGRSLADLLASMLCIGFVLLTGLVVGWRPDTSVWSFLGGVAIALLFSYALSWACACLGIVSKGAESAQGIGLIVLFPLAIVSNGMVPTGGMPSWLRTIADWNPVSAVTSAVRVRFGNPNPSHSVASWPMQHPDLASLLWTAVILAVAVPLAAHLFSRRTTS
jgi:ABC-2 type transport system permease protein